MLAGVKIELVVRSTLCRYVLFQPGPETQVDGKGSVCLYQARSETHLCVKGSVQPIEEKENADSTQLRLHEREVKS